MSNPSTHIVTPHCTRLGRLRSGFLSLKLQVLGTSGRMIRRQKPKNPKDELIVEYEFIPRSLDTPPESSSSGTQTTPTVSNASSTQTILRIPRTFPATAPVHPPPATRLPSATSFPLIPNFTDAPALTTSRSVPSLTSRASSAADSASIGPRRARASSFVKSTRLNVPVCYHQDLLSMPRSQLLDVTCALNDCLPANMKIPLIVDGRDVDTQHIRTEIQRVVRSRKDLPGVLASVRRGVKSVSFVEPKGGEKMVPAPATTPAPVPRQSPPTSTFLLKDAKENVAPIHHQLSSMPSARRYHWRSSSLSNQSQVHLLALAKRTHSSRFLEHLPEGGGEPGEKLIVSGATSSGSRSPPPADTGTASNKGNSGQVVGSPPQSSSLRVEESPRPSHALSVSISCPSLGAPASINTNPRLHLLADIPSSPIGFYAENWSL